VTNVDHNPTGRLYFDAGLRFMIGFQHELASKCFLACLQYSPHAALAHGLIALCHGPNYNFKGAAYYMSSWNENEIDMDDELCAFPSQVVAERHSRMALQIVEDIKIQHSQATDDSMLLPDLISDVEMELLMAIRVLTGKPSSDAAMLEENAAKPYADALRRLYERFPDDPEILYYFAEALMTLDAWKLYEFPSGRPISAYVDEIRHVLDRALQMHPYHPGLCHLFVHLSEMSSMPELALKYCDVLKRTQSGHLVHMPSHIEVLLGEYEHCVESNLAANDADRHFRKLSPQTAGIESFYFVYVAHNYHMAVYGCILGGMEAKGMEVSKELGSILTEDLFERHPHVAIYLESFAAMEVHVLVRFGRWVEILEIEMPRNPDLMLFRTASIYAARALSYAMMNDGSNGYDELAMSEAERFEQFCQKHDQSMQERILFNNTVADLLAIDSAMIRGELAYRSKRYEEGLELLREAVKLQDNLSYDEPWGKMQPVRHALGGLLVEQGHLKEAESVFRHDLRLHPRNPWALVGLIQCLQQQEKHPDAAAEVQEQHQYTIQDEIRELKQQLRNQRKMKWADFDIAVPCECCSRKSA
jgi:tetratricopeptide (TPR) repeat protein